jgi:hypothetical protein
VHVLLTFRIPWLQALEKGLKDTVETYKMFCLECACDLLKSKPEKEDALLRMTVNKVVSVCT